jgi:hypothetical protein
VWKQGEVDEKGSACSAFAIDDDYNRRAAGDSDFTPLMDSAASLETDLESPDE